MSTMDLNSFLAMVESYGSDPNRWPADRRAAAEALLAARSSLSGVDRARLQAVLEAEGALDVILAAAPVQAPGPGLAERILAAAPQGPAERPARAGRRWFSWLLDGPMWRPTMPLVAAVAVGVWLGGTLGDSVGLPLIGSDSEAWAAVDFEDIVFGVFEGEALIEDEALIEEGP